MNLQETLNYLRETAESLLEPGKRHTGTAVCDFNGHKIKAVAELPFGYSTRRVHARTSFRVNGKRVALADVQAAVVPELPTA